MQHQWSLALHGSQHQWSLALHDSQQLGEGCQTASVAKSLLTAGTMVMSLAQSPGKINIVSMLLLELDMNVSISHVHCYSQDKEKLPCKVLIDLGSQLKNRKSH